MSFKRLLIALALALGLGAAAHAAPLSAYGGLPSVESVEISPDGALLATITYDGEQRSLTIAPVTGGAPQSYSVGAAKVRRLDWVGSDYLIISTSQTAAIPFLIGNRREYSRAFALNLATRKLQPLLDKSPARSQTGTHFRDNSTAAIWASMNVLAAPPEVRDIAGQPALFLTSISFAGSYAVLTIIRADLKTGAQKVVQLGDPDTNAILLGQDGAPVAKTDYDRQTGRWSLRLRRPNGGWSEDRVTSAKTEEPVLIGLGRDGQSVVIAEQGDSGYLIREIAPDGTAGEPLDVRDADGPIFDPDTHRLIGVYALVGDEHRYTFFDPKDQKSWDAVREAFKGDRVQLESWSRDRRRIVVLVDSAVEGPGYALVDLAARKAEWLGARYQKLLPEDLSPVRAIRFKAKDGLDLTGYVTLPAGKPPRNLPLVVLPHGGPASRDEPGFDWWAQAIASRGYAVLQVNFRGSDGFGWRFTQAGFGQWGRKMQTDLSDGVRYLAGQGTIDPKRVCIVGASYGGYAALAGAALDPGVYRCAASIAGLSDLRRFVDWSRRQNGIGAQRYWTRFMGAEASSDPALAEISPIDHIDAITAPILLIHGQDDTVVPIEQSRMMAEALTRAGKPVEFLVQKGEDHWLSRGDSRLQMLTATMAFVEKHNPPN
ncbi:S9 family peptidase [Phenylobacterium sp.]|uniref:alpha/beta hydrolase family protein n=1 Tax=Phenylobacterium sp. TaxID=1871053 RepID=UPI0025EA3A3E|nr:S9 family peptidase [Phenylobacterium sp.]